MADLKTIWSLSKYTVGAVSSAVAFTATNKVIEAAIDAGMDITQDYIYSQLNAKLGTQFDNPFMKSFMTSLKMSVVSDASASCMGYAMKTNMRITSYVDERRQRINARYKEKLANKGSWFNKKSQAIANQGLDEKRGRELQQLDNQAQNLYSAVSGAGYSSGAYMQGIGTMKTGFQATVPQVVNDPNMLKLVNGMGYFPDRS